MSQDMLKAAALWHARQDDDDMDWPGFTAWLEEHPRHRDAFDAIALLDDDIDRDRDTLRRLLPAETPVAAPGGKRWWVVGAGTATAAVAAAIALVVIDRRPEPLATPPVAYRADAMPRDVQIADARIALAPGSSIAARAGEPGRLALSGRAVFAVAHDPARTLLIETEGFQIRDVGTRFEVVAGAGTVRVTVAEGEVSVRAIGGGDPVAVTAGHAATGYADGRIVTAGAPRAALGGWRNGPLVYDAMPLGLVAADIGRATGKTVVVDRAIAARPFSGIVAPGRDASGVNALAALAGLEARRQGDTIVLGDRARR